MVQKNNRSITPSKYGGIFYDLANRIKLIFRLMGDHRVSSWLKLLPIATLVYLVVPDLAPGPIDDAAAIWLGAYLFVELCPPELVNEHMESLNPHLETKSEDVIDEANIVDVEYWDDN